MIKIVANGLAILSMLEVCWNWPTSYIWGGIYSPRKFCCTGQGTLFIPRPSVPILLRTMHVIMDMELPLYSPPYATLSVVKL